MIEKALVQILTVDENVLVEHEFKQEFHANIKFDEIEKVRLPLTYMGHTIQVSEYFDNDCVGFLRLVVIDSKGNRYLRRELYRYQLSKTSD